MNYPSLFPTMSHPWLWDTSSGVVVAGVFAAEALRMSPTAGDETSCGRILRMEDAVTSEEEDADSQNFNIPMDHGHLARNYLMKKVVHFFPHWDYQVC